MCGGKYDKTSGSLDSGRCKGDSLNAYENISTIVRAKEIYSRQPCIRHFRAVRTGLAPMIENYQLEEVESIEVMHKSSESRGTQ